MEILEKAKELEKLGRKVIHFEIGEPDLPVPQKVKERAKEALSKYELKYTESTGIPQLKEAIANYYYETYRVVVEPTQIVITPGSSPALMAALKVVSERVGTVSYPDPGYPCYKNLLKLLNLEGIALPAFEEHGFKVQSFQVSTPALIVNSPANPTGTVYSRWELEKLAGKAFLISDEIYHGLTYRKPATSALQITRNCVVVNGFSKFFLMTGWRLGWAVVPKETLEEFTAILQNAVISPPTLSQLAALSCFDEEVLSQLKENVKTFYKRMKAMVEGLREIGFKVPQEPEGAFYVWADASAFTDDTYRFALELLENVSVATTPGIDFGKNGTSRFLRFSFCTGMEEISEGLERLYRYLRRR